MLRGLVRLIRYMDGLTSRADLQIVNELLREANVERDDMVEACKFSTQHYARNELAKSPWYQLLVICWREGQSSPIHDHFGSGCGVRVVDGIATETIFEPMSSGLVRPVRESHYGKGDVCVNSDSDIHLITNEQSNQDLITLHLYSPPLKMRFYERSPASVV
jgi:cysteine dioxygenase